MLFYRDKKVEGVTFINWLVNFSIHPLSSMLLMGLNSTTKIRNVCNAGADGVLLLKRQKALEGFLKFADD